jgi:hypothetical protein
VIVQAYPPISLRIPLETPSVNAWHGAHWRRYRLHFDRWFVQLRARLTPRAAPPDCLIRGRIITYRGRLLDYANLVGGCKPIPDVLKRLGYLKDDSPKWWDAVYAEHLAPPEERHTLIQLWRPT